MVVTVLSTYVYNKGNVFLFISPSKWAVSCVGVELCQAGQDWSDERIATEEDIQRHTRTYDGPETLSLVFFSGCTQSHAVECPGDSGSVVLPAGFPVFGGVRQTLS